MLVVMLVVIDAPVTANVSTAIKDPGATKSIV